MDYDLLVPIWKFMLHLKYGAIILVMFLDNTILPFPGEIVLIVAGYLIYLKQLNFWLVVLACAIGSVCGSLIGYEIGRRYGEDTVAKYGKYVLLGKKELKRANVWFDKHGHVTLFYSRFIPGVGHLISVPAGAAKMHRSKFIVFSFLAACVWYFIITYLCLIFSRNLEMLTVYLRPLQVIGVILLLIVIVWFLQKRFT